MQEKFKPIIIVLCGGNGERMKSSKPKVLHEIGSQTLIEYMLKLSKVINDNHLNTYVVINKKLQNNRQFQELHTQYQFTQIIQEKSLGTGDAIKIAYTSIKDTKDLFLILYGDTPFIKPKTVYRLQQQINEGADLALVAFNTKNNNAYGRIILSGANRVLQVVEEKDATSEQKEISLCNSGIILVKKELLADFLTKNSQKSYSITNEFYLTNIVGFATTKGKICTYVLSDENEVMGVNDKNQLVVAEEYNQKVIHKNIIANGVSIIKPESSYFATNIKIYPDVVIYPNVFIGKNTVIMNNATIHSFSHIEEAQIEENAIIGPFARLRSQTKIGKNSKIGNFVELKNSILMENVKAGHLSYIGDARIYNDVNIGAGTVFCNYDGKRKLHSEVREKVFIGSNTSIISPITIKSKAMIAAGSVITKNVEEKALAIARAKQKNLKNKSKIK